jgi:hypothetical protein
VSRPLALTDEKLRFLLTYGMLAPPHGSAHPWTIRASHGLIELFVEHRCERPLHDVAHRELVVSCGVALAQLRLALRQLGARESVALFPDPSRPELIASLALEEHSGVATPESYVLFQALGHTARDDDANAARERHSIPAELLSELTGLCASERTLLRYVASDAFVSSEPLEPMPRACEAPTVADVVALLHPFRARTFDPTAQSWFEERDFSLLLPIVGVLATPTDEVRDWLACGQALGRLLLRARVDGLHASFREGREELESLRARLRRGRSAGAGVCIPQIMFRLGYPQKTEVVRLEIPRYALPVTTMPGYS